MNSSLRPAKENMAAQAYRRLIQMLASGKIRQADIVSQRQLAKLLGMSITPVGLALQRLEQDGLVHAVARSRTQICRVDADAMWGMLNWRIALECQIVRLACERISAADAKRLSLLARQTDALYVKSPAASIVPDAKFHMAIGKLCGCAKLCAELDKLNVYYLKLAVYETVPMQTQPDLSSTPTHCALVKAVIEGDQDKSERLLRQHLEGSAQTTAFAAWYRRARFPARRSQVMK